MIISQVTRSSLNRSKPQQRLGEILVVLLPVLYWAPFLCKLVNEILTIKPKVLGTSISDFFSSQSGYSHHCSCLLIAGWFGPILLESTAVAKYEGYLHAFHWSCGLASDVTNLILENYNPANWDCWIAPLPGDCTSSFEIRQGNSDLTETDFIRGDNTNIYQWVFFFGPLWVCGVFCLVVMFQVYTTVYKAENRTGRSRLSMNTELRWQWKLSISPWHTPWLSLLFGLYQLL